jgi:hypothetical protein
MEKKRCCAGEALISGKAIGLGYPESEVRGYEEAESKMLYVSKAVLKESF